ncbi:MAG: hypothetical protein ABW164_04505 [Sphingobium sp.]
MTPRAALLAFGALALIAARPPMRVQPNPSAVIAAEIGFNRLAQARGQWTAYRETAAKDAVLFVPQRVVARDWLKGRADPPQAARWSPATVYVACDGRIAASSGTMQRPDGSAGYVTTIWRLDEKGAWRWIMRHEGQGATPAAVPDQLTGKVATCKRPDGTPPPAGAAPPADESLLWSAQADPDGGRRVTVRMWTGEAYDTVIDDRVKAGAV